MTMADANTASAINRLSTYLSDEQLSSLSSAAPVDCIVVCASMILHQAELVFDTLSQRPSLARVLVLCGGIGHSTQSLYEAVSQHPRFSAISHAIRGLPEARVLEKILDDFFDRPSITSQGCRILVEDQSTNCGQNAFLTRRVLETAGFVQLSPTPVVVVVVVQDPTMMRRTTASFRKVYDDLPQPPVFVSCPVFVPRMCLSPAGALDYLGSSPNGILWPHSRFFSLIMGEIPRLRDDEAGYGPRGKGFIPHVDVPSEVEAAWTLLRDVLDTSR